MKKPTLLIIGKGGKKEGMGHLVRIATMVEAFSQYYNITVLSQHDRFGDLFFKQTAISSYYYKDNRALYRFLDENGPYNVILIDIYRITPPTLDKISAHCEKLVNFDDMKRRLHYPIHGTYICPQEPFNRSDETIGNGQTRIVSGTDFFPLKPLFREYRRQKKFQDDVKDIGIILGGVPSPSYTLELTAQLDRFLEPYVRVHVVMGYSPDQVDGQSFSSRVHFYKNIENMAEFISRLDVGIIAGGFIKFEFMCIGTPFVLVSLCAHQQKLARAFSQKGYGVYLGPIQKLTGQPANHAYFKKRMQAFLSGTPMRRQMFERNRALVDGNGAKRVLELIGN